MDFKKPNLRKIKFLLIALCAIGWSQTATAQYNLQLDSVITDITTGTFTVNTSQTKIYVVPSKKIWKITNIISEASGGNYGSLIVEILDHNGSTIRWSNESNAYNNTSTFHPGGRSTEEGILWLNQGCQIVITLSPALNGLYDNSMYYCLINALQFSTQ